MTGITGAAGSSPTSARRQLRVVKDDEAPVSRYPIKHRASRPGYDWPIRFEWERDRG